MITARYFSHASDLPDRVGERTTTVYFVVRKDGTCFRVIQCRSCRLYGYETDLWCYGGSGNMLNQGECYHCFDQRRKKASIRLPLYAVQPSMLHDPV